MKFSTKDFFSFFLQFPADLVTFTEEILNGKLRFLCSENIENFINPVFMQIQILSQLCHELRTIGNDPNLK